MNDKARRKVKWGHNVCLARMVPGLSVPDCKGKCRFWTFKALFFTHLQSDSENLKRNFILKMTKPAITISTLANFSQHIYEAKAKIIQYKTPRVHGWVHGACCWSIGQWTPEQKQGSAGFCRNACPGTLWHQWQDQVPGSFFQSQKHPSLTQQRGFLHTSVSAQPPGEV